MSTSNAKQNDNARTNDSLPGTDQSFDAGVAMEIADQLLQMRAEVGEIRIGLVVALELAAEIRETMHDMNTAKLEFVLASIDQRLEDLEITSLTAGGSNPQ